MLNLRDGSPEERYKRVDGFWVEENGTENFYLPEDFMTPAQGEAYVQRFQQRIDGLNHQFKVLFGEQWGR